MQRVLVTAGGSGIGACLVRRFAAGGAQVAFCDIDQAAVLATMAAVPGSFGMQANVTDEADMAAFFDAAEAHLGGIDVVCANAGTGGPAGPIEALDYADWQGCLNVNLGGTFLTCRWAAERLKAQGSGLIVLTSSTAGLFGYPLRSPYATAKWGLVGLTKTLAMELGPHGVRVNAICPGAVEGDRMDRVVAMEAEAGGRPEAEVREAYVKGVSLRSWVTADEIADTVLYLASDAARKISGQILAIDGHTETLVP